MLPIVALIGRHNVGKSTFFNKLTRTRNALVGSFPGLTRDRQYGRVELKGFEFIVMDTAGLDYIHDNVKDHARLKFKKNIQDNMIVQSLLAIKEADIVLFMVDGRAGVVAADYEIASHLHSCNKSTFLVVNKTDGLNLDVAILDFYSLGFHEIYPITASHGRGITILLEKIMLSCMSTGNLEHTNKEKNTIDKNSLMLQKKDNFQHIEKKDFFHLIDQPIKLAIVGRPNAGKSTLINQFLGYDRVMVCNMPGTTRDSIFIPLEHNKQKYILIDTAGVRKRSRIVDDSEQFSMIKTMQSIEQSNVVVLVVDACIGISDQDLSLVNFIINSGRCLVISINKWDKISQEKQLEFKKNMNFRLSFIDFIRVHFISALHGNGVKKIFKSVIEAHKNATMHISPSVLTRIMNTAVHNHQPSLVHGQCVKLKYAHMGGHNPPMIIIHGNRLKHLTLSYKRYLINFFRNSLNTTGTPIHVQFKESVNPYKGKHNLLTSSQKRKRKRLMDYLKSNKR
ncbi:ribosome biogenesis GTPase Der [Candidatus Pantoea carbekii]|uniref:ribosome biogenesis GTPase Der n=1 Tax=Candidatus Pantoea carbekii TaxID=1235990 RepID=UPI000618741C|nr:ribosome biogenesis GTPase Der [Candidatus Pantoea carbekii]AKC31859.1 GTP-binding protein EngA [Candidatus Pantoea carbekii]